MTPSQRGLYLENKTVALLASVGIRAERVCRGGGAPGRGGRKDAFGCVDLVAIDSNGIVSLIQVTTKDGASARRKKIRDAKLNAPVRLFKWQKVKNRWIAFSEEVLPTEPFLFADYGDGSTMERPEAVLETPAPGLTEAPLYRSST